MKRSVTTLLSVATGAVSAGVGLLPWLVTDRRLPLQNIWDELVMQDDMPVAFVPLSQYFVVNIAAMVLVGAAVAGISVRLAARRDVALQPWLVTLSLVALQAGALIQSTIVLLAGLEVSSRGHIYAYGMAAGVAITIGLGALVLLGLARGAMTAIVLSLTATSLALATWIPLLVRPFGDAWSSAMPADVVRTAWSLSTWLPALVVGALIGWCGASTVRRFVTSFAAVTALWVVPAVITTVMHTLGSRVLLRFPADLPEVAVQTFLNALVSFGAPQRIFVALAIAVVVAITLRSIRGGPPR